MMQEFGRKFTDENGNNRRVFQHKQSSRLNGGFVVMEIDKRDAEIMVRLAREGKHISRICEDDFPQYDYIDIYVTIYGSGERSSLGIKRMITNRLQLLEKSPKKQQKEIIDEIDDLVCRLYYRFQENQKKLDEIRSVINR